MSKTVIVVDALCAIAIAWPWVKARFDAWRHRITSSRERRSPMSEVVDEVQELTGADAADAVTDPEPVSGDAAAATATVTGALVLDDGTAAVLTAQVAQAGSQSKEAAMLQPVLDTLAASVSPDLASTTVVVDPPAKPSIPQEVAKLESSADSLAQALDALVAKLAPVMADTPTVAGEAGQPEDKRPPLAGQLGAVNGKLAYMLALINATAAAVEL